jgi:hypothetical protein
MLVFIKNENPSRLFLNVGSSFIIDVNHDKHVVKAFFLTVEIAKIWHNFFSYTAVTKIIIGMQLPVLIMFISVTP